jgi:hypothetical protein
VWEESALRCLVIPHSCASALFVKLLKYNETQAFCVFEKKNPSVVPSAGLLVNTKTCMREQLIYIIQIQSSMNSYGFCAFELHICNELDLYLYHNGREHS